MDDVWKDISSLPSLHHPTTYHFQDFFALGARPDGRANTLRQPQPPPPPPQPQLPLVTMSSLSTTSGNYSVNDHQQALHINTTTGATSLHVVKERSSPPEYSDKFKRLMKNRESAVRYRARKQARANELEQEILRLKKENAELKRLQKELCSTKAAQLRNEPMLHRTRSSPF